MPQPWETAGSVGARRPNTAPTYVLEYLVSELADGITPAPQFEVEGAIPSDGPFPDAEQIYVFPVARLGLIDLSLSGILPPELADAPSGLGQRYVAWAWCSGFVLGAVSPLQKANRIGPEGVVNLQALEVLPAAASQFYSRKGYVMPQGTVLRLQNMAPAVPGVPFTVRIGVIVPPTIRDDALMREAFCCTEDIPTTTDTDGECVDPNFLTPGVTPNSFSAGVNTIAIHAFPVSPETGFTSVAINGPFAPLVPTNVEIIFPDTILVTANFADVGLYSVTVTNNADVACQATLPNAFEVI
jgi:hypothetical protein